MRWRPEFIRCIGKRGDDFMVVLDIARVFAAAPRDEAAPGRLGPGTTGGLGGAASSQRNDLMRITIKLKLGLAFAAIIVLVGDHGWLGINSLGVAERHRWTAWSPVRSSGSTWPATVNRLLLRCGPRRIMLAERLTVAGDEILADAHVDAENRLMPSPTETVARGASATKLRRRRGQRAR